MENKDKDLNRGGTWQGDLSRKPITYSALGVEEYIVADVTGEMLEQRLLLWFGQFKAADPETDCSRRNAETARNCLDRQPFFRTQLPCAFALTCFHIGKLAEAPDGKKRPVGIEPTTRGWKPLVIPLHHGRGAQ